MDRRYGVQFSLTVEGRVLCVMPMRCRESRGDYEITNECLGMDCGERLAVRDVFVVYIAWVTMIIHIFSGRC